MRRGLIIITEDLGARPETNATERDTAGRASQDADISPTLSVDIEQPTPVTTSNDNILPLKCSSNSPCKENTNGDEGASTNDGEDNNDSHDNLVSMDRSRCNIQQVCDDVCSQGQSPSERSDASECRAPSKEISQDASVSGDGIGSREVVSDISMLRSESVYKHFLVWILATWIQASIRCNQA